MIFGFHTYVIYSRSNLSSICNTDHRDTTLLQEACRRGSLSVCRYLRSNGCVLGDAAVAAAGAGHVEVSIHKAARNFVSFFFHID